MTAKYTHMACVRLSESDYEALKSIGPHYCVPQTIRAIVEGHLHDKDVAHVKVRSMGFDIEPVNISLPIIAAPVVFNDPMPVRIEYSQAITDFNACKRRTSVTWGRKAELLIRCLAECWPVKSTGEFQNLSEAEVHAFTMFIIRKYPLLHWNQILRVNAAQFKAGWGKIVKNTAWLHLLVIIPAAESNRSMIEYTISRRRVVKAIKDEQQEDLERAQTLVQSL